MLRGDPSAYTATHHLQYISKSQAKPSMQFVPWNFFRTVPPGRGKLHEVSSATLPHAA